MESRFLEKPNNLWFTIGGMIITFAVSLAFLQANVNAQSEKIVGYKEDVQRLEQKIDALIKANESLLVNQASMGKDIEYIKDAVIVVQQE